ncbi:hypothetical protein BsWGS_06940 [Bradybaena similaris]
MALSTKYTTGIWTACVFSSFLQHFVSVHSAKLNAPKVLLPFYSSVVVNYTLEVQYSPEDAQTENTCYQWRSSRPDVADVHLVNSRDGTCSQVAIISAVSRTTHQVTTVIVAENKETGEVLRSNVNVGEIVHLQIQTTTRSLFLEDTPEELIAQAVDSEGNIFSSLEGMSFEWDIMMDKESGQDVHDVNNILRIKRFTDSHYVTPRHIEALEQQGLMGDMVLVEGIQTGSAKVSVRFRDPAYKHVHSDDVRMMVVANLMLSPPDAYLLIHGRVQYKVELLRQNTLTQIKMPSKQYYLAVKDMTVCQLDAQTSMAMALALGSTEVALHDRNIAVSEFFPQPTALIHVVTPAALVFVVLPGKKWVLETGKEYDIYFEIYDADSHRLYPSDNVRVVGDFPAQYLQVLYSSINGTYHRVRALLKGETTIDGLLASIVGDAGVEYTVSPQVRHSQNVEIYDPITVRPAAVVFPWDPASRCVHTFTARATGGSGDYIWSVRETQVASVNTRGQITTLGAGQSNITAADVKNVAIVGVSAVYVLPPANLSFPPSVVEAVVGSKLHLPLSVAADIGGVMTAFTDCRQLTVNVSQTDMSVFEYIPHDEDSPRDLPENSCKFLSFIARHQGHTEVIATYRSKNIMLRAAVTIAAFHPLKAVDPELEAVVAVGSSREVVFVGGPQPWVLDPSSFFHEFGNITRVDPIHIQWQSPGMRGAHAVIITCNDLFNQDIQISVGNRRTAKNRFPLSQTASVRFICAEPVELRLAPVLTSRPHLPPCPIAYENNIAMPAHFGADLELVVTVTDSFGRHFDNFSSLAIDWTVSSPDLLELLHPRDLRTQNVSHERSTVSVRQTVRPHRKVGAVVVTASINHYKSWVSKVLARKMEKITPAISRSLELLLVEEAVLFPSSVSIFNHPSNKVGIEVLHGSGYFQLEDIQSQVLTAKYGYKSRTVEVTPLKDGTQTFTVYDLCIDVPSDPVATVTVSGVSSVQVIVTDKVEVMKEVTSSVQVLDLKGKPLLASFFSLMDLRLETSSDIVTIRPVTVNAQKSVTKHYTVYGSAVGHTTLTATIRLPSGQVVYSSPKSVEVFPPLRLDPKNITLVIGAVFQVLAFGGPQSQSSVEFAIINNQVASVSSGGVLDASSVGTTRVVGKSLGIDSMTGEKVIYTQDEAVVNVVSLKGIRIHVPVTRLQTGTQMPVYAVGLTEHQTPFSFGHSVPPLTFTWSVSSRETLHLQSVYHKTGIQPLAENNFAQQAVAKESGQVSIKLKVEARPKSRLQIPGDVLQDEIQIHVFDKLALLQPAICHGHILMTPNTDTILRTNRDQSARVRLLVRDTNPETAVVRLLDNGQLRSGPTPGTAVLHVLAQEEFALNQSLVVQVMVKPVSYLMINSDTLLETSYPNRLSAVPVGGTMQFSVSYHDDVGEEFDATNSHLGVRCSRSDIVQVSAGVNNQTLVVRATEAGSTVLKVWDKNRPMVTDYVSIPVASAIEPSQVSVTLGSIICFSSPIVAEKGTWGWWRTTPAGVLDLDAMSAIAVGTAVGLSTVVYAFSSHSSTKTEITIDPIKLISVSQGTGYLTNSVTRGKVPFFPVSFGDGGSITGPNCSCVISREDFRPAFIPYTCQLVLAQHDLDVITGDLFTVAPHFDQDNGVHGCLVSQNPSSHLSQLVATLDTSFVLSVRVPPSAGQPEVVSQALTLDFLPAFYVHNAEVHLSTVSPLSSIRISSSAKVISDIQVVVTDPNLIQVLSPERDSNSNNVILFPVRLLDSLTLWEREHLDLAVDAVHTRTGHTVRIPVIVKLIGQKPEIPHLNTFRQDLSWSAILSSMVSNYQSGLIICFIIILIATTTMIGYHAVAGPKYKTTSNPNVFLNTGSVQPSPTSSFIQPSVTGSSSFTSPGRLSPTTPKLWSVSYSQDLRTSPFKRNSYSSAKT